MKIGVFRVFVLLIFGFITSTNAQSTGEKPEIKTGLRLSGVNLMFMAPHINSGDFSLLRMRTLAPESELLNRDLSSFETDYAYTESGYIKVPPISILLNVDIHSKNNLIQKLRPEIRVGLGYRNSQLIGGGLSREDTYSAQKDDGTPIDSIREQNLGFNNVVHMVNGHLSFLVKSNPERRFSIYGGVGFEGGVSLKSTNKVL